MHDNGDEDYDYNKTTLKAMIQNKSPDNKNSDNNNIKDIKYRTVA